MQNGNFEIALGTVAAEKLKIGIPARPLRPELEELIADITGDIAGSRSQSGDRPGADFIRSMYDLAQPPKDIFSPEEKTAIGNERLILKRDIPRADLERFWNMTASSGRNDVRLSAVIDIKAVPETIRPGKWDGELMPALAAEDKPPVEAAYE